MAQETWEEVSDQELAQIWETMQRTNTISNGGTDLALQQKYGVANVKHVMGVGWYRKVG